MSLTNRWSKEGRSLARAIRPLTFETPAALEPQVTKVMHRWHLCRSGGDVLISNVVLLAMMQMASAALLNETGGTLVGHYEEADSMAVVEKALGVRRGAEQGATHFFRPSDEVDGQLAEIYRATGGHMHYLGEWHTHPFSSPSPSRIDLRTLRELAQSPAVAIDTPLLLILGGRITEAPVIRCLVMDANGRHEDAIYLGDHAEVDERHT